MVAKSNNKPKPVSGKRGVSKKRNPGQHVETELELRQIMARFLETFAATANMTASCQAAGVDPETIYRWSRQDYIFGRQFVAANAAANDHVDAEILRRGVEGWDEPVFHSGVIVGHVRRYSDLLLIFLAKARMPEKYRERFEVKITYEERRRTLVEAALAEGASDDEAADIVDKLLLEGGEK